MATTFRSDAAAAVLGLLTTYQTANPTRLRHVTRARPSSVGETPAAWIGEVTESIRNSANIRQRTFIIPIVVVDQLADNSETLNRLDDLVDALIDVVTAAPHAVSGATLIEPSGVSEVEIDGPFHGVAINVSGLIQEGRT